MSVPATFTTLANALDRIATGPLPDVAVLDLGLPDLLKGRGGSERLTMSLLYAVERHRLARARAEFFAFISHEFRVPLTTIRGFTGLMLYRGFDLRDTGAVRESLEAIGRASDVLIVQVNSILELTKLTSGAMHVDVRPVELAPLIEEAKASMEPLADDAEIDLVVSTTAEETWVMADPNRLGQVLSNLLSNAIKFTPGGGRVQVVTAVASDEVQIGVHDTGIGIEAGAVAHIFEPYYRVRGAQTQKGQPSTGLGLALTKAIVDALGGSITVDSTPERGRPSRFTSRGCSPARSVRCCAASVHGCRRPEVDDVRSASARSRIDSACSSSSAVIVSGGISRRT